MPAKEQKGITFGDFEEFHHLWKKQFFGSHLAYFSDSIFVAIWNSPSSTGRRFRYGLIVWALRILAFALLKTLKRQHIPSPPSSHCGFWFTSTPAHEESLTPILDQELEGPAVTYNAPKPYSKNNYVTPIGLNARLATSTFLAALRATFQSAYFAIQVKKFLKRMPKLESVTTKELTVRTAEIFLYDRLFYTNLTKYEFPHNHVFLTYELSPDTKAWVRRARQSGARVTHVMHGQRLPSYQVTMATDLVLFSKLDEPWFRERVDSNVKLWTVGHPRLEAIREKVGLPLLRGANHTPRIVFFSQPVEGDYSRELRKKDWEILQSLRGRADLRIRLHPRENKKKAMEDLDALELHFIQVSDAGLTADMKWCDAAASSWSTVSMEAAACGRGIFWTCSTPEKYEASQELRDAGIGCLIQGADEWGKHLDDWKTQGWSSPVVVPEEKLRKLGMIGDMERPWIERLHLDS